VLNAIKDKKIFRTGSHRHAEKLDMVN